MALAVAHATHLEIWVEFPAPAFSCMVAEDTPGVSRKIEVL